MASKMKLGIEERVPRACNFIAQVAPDIQP
jgi:hypothetical protein